MSEETKVTKDKTAMSDQKTASEKPKPAKSQSQDSYTFQDWAAI